MAELRGPFFRAVRMRPCGLPATGPAGRSARRARCCRVDQLGRTGGGPDQASLDSATAATLTVPIGITSVAPVTAVWMPRGAVATISAISPLLATGPLTPCASIASKRAIAPVAARTRLEGVAVAPLSAVAAEGGMAIASFTSIGGRSWRSAYRARGRVARPPIIPVSPTGRVPRLPERVAGRIAAVPRRHHQRTRDSDPRSQQETCDEVLHMRSSTSPDTNLNQRKR